ncbi:hypothetical protein H5410_002853, partial [Solanum commersonii]
RCGTKEAKTLEDIRFHTWSIIFCLGNWYIIVNTILYNITETVNDMFAIEREFPIVALFDEINRRFAYFTRGVWSR